ncbi:hypothetical protein DFQ05_0913 [Winogradskyella wandonensis]|uniref:Uncharacterized protein n=1 Tax=Winogradskyella wandonensis TaxID=1442586 RepID=A0A4R1KW13_9FLAO|nr:hypothetical protein [Winogradskyella wandonensis]TCK69392.1 hypothetical protein DFQ05_0913 [Winogradskyella wandonensis]
MKRLQFNALASDIFITIYVLVTLFLRFKLESQTATGAIESVVMGLCFVVLLWAMIKLKFLNPNWFGLFKTKSKS